MEKSVGFGTARLLDKAPVGWDFRAMTAEKIKQLLNGTPFRPFRIHLPSGNTVVIAARDFAAISPSGRTLLVLGENESETLVDVGLIERVEVLPAP